MNYNYKNPIKILIIGLVLLFLIGGGVYYFINKNNQNRIINQQNQKISDNVKKNLSDAEAENTITKNALDSYVSNSKNKIEMKELPKECSSQSTKICDNFFSLDDCACSSGAIEKIISNIKNKEIKDYSFFDNPEVFKKLLESVVSNPKEISVSKGNFDFADKNKKILIASANSYSDNSLFIFIMDEDFRLNILEGDGYNNQYISFKNNPIKILNNYPEFFVGNESGTGGSCGNAGAVDNIYFIKNLNFLIGAQIEATQIDEDTKPVGYIYKTNCPYRSLTVSKYSYSDIDNDQENEIIVSYTKKPFEGDDATINKFSEFLGNVIYKWDVPTEKFNILRDERVLYGATEIVSNNLPGSAEFWVEAYCPGSGTAYDYKIPSEYANNYKITSCEKGDDGSHGGCPGCIMSKIMISK